MLSLFAISYPQGFADLPPRSYLSKLRIQRFAIVSGFKDLALASNLHFRKLLIHNHHSTCLRDLVMKRVIYSLHRPPWYQTFPRNQVLHSLDRHLLSHHAALLVTSVGAAEKVSSAIARPEKAPSQSDAQEMDAVFGPLTRMTTEHTNRKRGQFLRRRRILPGLSTIGAKKWRCKTV